MNDQTRAPLAETVEQYIKEKVVRFHMPGHKGGRVIAPLTEQVLGKRLFELDVTSVEGMDDLLQPKGVIKQAERLLAEAFGADQSYFLINGTSSGLQALIVSQTATNDEILVPRNMHKSMVAGLVLSGAKPVFLLPEVNEDFGIALGITPATLQQALMTHPAAKAALLINPTYYGTVCDLESLVQILHEKGLPMLIDEAHGPHFYFHEDLPTGALVAGVDATAQGAHKTLTSLTQSSWLHVKGSLINKERLQAALAVLLSTSASYPLMASLDLTRRQMVLEGHRIFERTIGLALELKSGLVQLPGLTVLDEQMLGGPAAVALDPTKVTVNVRQLGLTGQQVELFLRYEHNIQVELSDLYNVLFMVGPGNTREDVQTLIAAFRDLVDKYQPQSVPAKSHPLPPLPVQAMTPRDAFFAAADSVPLSASVGRISAEAVTCYPPGIPILCPGEIITPEIVEHVSLMLAQGYQIQGPRDKGVTHLRVVRA